MEKHQIITFFNNLNIIKNCNIERIYFFRENVLKNFYLLPWQTNKLIKSIVVYNEVFSTDKYDLYETILLNINQNSTEPNFIFIKEKDKELVTTKYLTKIPKYQKRYLLLNFKNTKNIKIHKIKEEIYFEIIPITQKLKNRDILFLVELNLKRKEIKELIHEIKNKRNKRT